ncbi:unnamed protein product [Mycena citricolor]|uniref:Cytochrome P450 n=1 Tax=Mycena citricolor TaxID=2018698 RepID=A0AAD2HME8_9AGAR|nr:unnamed protein product [Mycena citricolor]
MDNPIPSLITLAAAFSVVVVLRRFFGSKSSSPAPPLPPGPRKLPFVGNLFSVSKGREWEAYARLGRELNSDIIHLDMAGTHLIVLNSAQAVDDLLNKKSALYSDRPRFTMLHDILRYDFSLTTMEYGPRWRKARRLLHQQANFETAKQFYATQESASRRFLKSLLTDPVSLQKNIHRLIAETILSFAYGLPIQRENDPLVGLSEAVTRIGMEAVTPGRFLVDSIPMLKHFPAWFPGAGFKRNLHEWRALGRSVVEAPFAQAAGMPTLSFITACLANSPMEDEQAIKGVAATMYTAGLDSTMAAVSTFFLAMLANPEAQATAQREIDAVTHGERLPDFSDREKMPYVGALVKEVLRWHVVTPIAIPHRVTVEDEYKGYRIPAGAYVVGNMHELLRDPTTFPDPDIFLPERFLDDSVARDMIGSIEIAYGFGRRICPGRYVAMATLWSTFSGVLATFDIAKAVDQHGDPIEPTYAYDSNLIDAPVPFECRIIPRNEELAKLLSGEEE